MRRDDEGVASTVGTIMALLVFLTFLSLIVNQYVPVWMKDSEAAHMSGALGQFGGFKGSVDLQVLAAQIAQDAGSHYIPVTTSNAVTLGTDGVPIFAAPTLGEMAVDPDAAAWTVEFYYDIRGVSTHVEEASSGAVSLSVQNRYFIPQRVVYENGAVIRWQSDGQVIRAPPVFEPVRLNGSLDLSFQLLSLYGRDSVSGTTTEVVNAKVFGLDRQDYVDLTSTLWVNHTSAYGVAWYQFFNNTLSEALGLASGSFVSVQNQQQVLLLEFTARQGVENVYRVRTSWDVISFVYRTTLEIFDTTFLPMGTFRLQHAHLQVGIGEASEDL
ncbi:MAG: hypothetical protein ACT4OI_03595 [Methanobacteriota archaeon]